MAENTSRRSLADICRAWLRGTDNDPRYAATADDADFDDRELDQVFPPAIEQEAADQAEIVRQVVSPLPQLEPEHARFVQWTPSPIGVVIRTERGDTLYQVTSPAEVDAVNARLAALIRPEFNLPLRTC